MKGKMAGLLGIHVDWRPRRTNYGHYHYRNCQRNSEQNKWKNKSLLVPKKTRQRFVQANISIAALEKVTECVNVKLAINIHCYLQTSLFSPFSRRGISHRIQCPLYELGGISACGSQRSIHTSTAAISPRATICGSDKTSPRGDRFRDKTITQCELTRPVIVDVDFGLSSLSPDSKCQLDMESPP